MTSSEIPSPEWVHIPTTGGLRYFCLSGKRLKILTQETTSKFLVMITGMSGSGKSTIGPKLADYLDAEYLDEDSFYKDSSTFERVEYTNLKTKEVTQVKLWDREECIDFEKLNENIDQLFSKADILVLTGFYLPPSKIKVFGREVVYVNLNIDIDTCLARRAISKGQKSKSFDLKRDRWMVTNYVSKFYFDGIAQIRRSFFIHEIDSRENVEEVWEEIVKIFL